LRAAEKEIAAKTNAMYKAERAFTDKIADLANLGDKIDKYSSLAELQKREIIALRAKLEAIKAPDEILLYVKGSHGVQPGNEHEGIDAPANVSISLDD
jgi:predicted  nucleic acid-binding Zn-ribbon protein